jgi:hypothetical protein
MLDLVFAVCLLICVFMQLLSFRVPTNAVMTSRDLELCENCFAEATDSSEGTRQVFIIEDFSVLVNDLMAESSP